MHKIHIQDDEGRTTVVPFVTDVITIGRNLASTIQLTERNVSREHARIFRSNNVVYIEDINSSYGTLVNGDPIAKATHVRPGDIVQIGDYRIRCREDLGDAAGDGPNATEPVPFRAVDSGTLRDTSSLPGDRQAILRPTEPGIFHEFSITQTCTSIGSATNNDWVLDHASVSRHHAEILFENEQFILANLTDKQNVRVNHEPYERIALQSGDEIRVGNVGFQFMMGTSAAPAWTETFINEIDDDPLPTQGNKKILGVAAVLLLVASGLCLHYVMELSKPRAPVVPTTTTEENAESPEEAKIKGEDPAAKEADEDKEAPAVNLLDEARSQWDSGSRDVALELLVKAEAVPEIAEEASKLRKAFELEKKLDELEELVDNEQYESALQFASTIEYEDDAAPERYKTLLSQAENSRLAELLELGKAAVNDANLGEAERWLRQMQRINAEAQETQTLAANIRESRQAMAKAKPKAKTRNKAKARAQASRAAPKAAAKPSKPAPKPKKVEPAAAPPPTPAPSQSEIKISNNPSEMYKNARRIFRKNPDGAVKLLLEVVRLKPGHAAAHKKLGIYFQTSGNKKKAAKHYRKYLELKPNAADAAAISATLQRLE